MLQMNLHGTTTVVQQNLDTGEVYTNHAMIQRDLIHILGKCLALLESQHGGTNNTEQITDILQTKQCGKIWKKVSLDKVIEKT